MNSPVDDMDEPFPSHERVAEIASLGECGLPEFQGQIKRAVKPLQHAVKHKVMRSLDERKTDLMGSAPEVGFDDAVTTIAELVHPELNQITGKKLIRDRVKYARKKEEFAVTRDGAGTLYVERFQFLQWVMKKWPSLAPILQIPTIGRADLTLPFFTCKAYGTSIPTDTAELTRQYVKLQTTVMQQAEEISECRDKIKMLEKELAERQRRDAETREKKSIAGRRGGRGNTL